MPGLRELSNTKSTLVLSRPIVYEVLLFEFKISCRRESPFLHSRNVSVADCAAALDRLHKLLATSSSACLYRVSEWYMPIFFCMSTRSDAICRQARELVTIYTLQNLFVVLILESPRGIADPGESGLITSLSMGCGLPQKVNLVSF